MSIKKIIAEKAKNYPPHSQINKKREEIMVIVKLFNCYSNCIWYITEYDPTTAIAFGYVERLDNKLLYDEWCCFNIDELANAKTTFNIPMIEVDKFFIPQAF
jgi:hypothetical protein